MYTVRRFRVTFQVSSVGDVVFEAVNEDEARDRWCDLSTSELIDLCDGLDGAFAIDEVDETDSEPEL